MIEAKRRPAEPGYCQAPSNQYMEWLEEAGGDPRIVASKHPAAEWRTPYRLAPSGQKITVKEVR